MLVWVGLGWVGLGRVVLFLFWEFFLMEREIPSFEKILLLFSTKMSADFLCGFFF